MMKSGNNHSSLLDSLVKAAETVKKPVVNNSFVDIVMNNLKNGQPKPLTVEDILRKHAQMDMQSPAPPAPGGSPAPGAPMGDPGAQEAPAGDPEAAKNSIAQALVDLCGGVEEAKQCIDAVGGSAENSMEQLPEEEPMQPMEMPAPMPMM